MNEEIKRELDLIKESVLNVVPDTEAIYLFGSHAYGMPHKDSDLDIYVVVPDTRSNFASLNAEIRGWLYKKKKRPLDLLIGKASVFNRRSKEPTIEKEIAQNGVKIYVQ